MFSQFEIQRIIPSLSFLKRSGSDIFKSAWNWKYMWEMHRSRDVHKSLMRAQWVMIFAHLFLASLQLGISIKCVAWLPRMSWKFSGFTACLQFPLLRLSLWLWVRTKRTCYFLGEYVIKENKLHWTGPKPENLRLCSQRNDKHQDRMSSFLFFEINKL